MFKALLGNALFAGLIWGWYYHIHGDRDLMVSGGVLAFASLLVGIFMGYILHGPTKVKRVLVYEQSTAVQVAAQVQEGNADRPLGDNTARPESNDATGDRRRAEIAFAPHDNRDASHDASAARNAPEMTQIVDSADPVNDATTISDSLELVADSSATSPGMQSPPTN